MNTTIKINLKSLKEISWEIVALFVVQFCGWITPKQAFVIYFVLLVGLVGFMKKIIFPNIAGLRFYLFFVLYSTVIGLALYGTRNVARDLYYVMPAIVLIILGYYFRVMHGREVSIMKTMVLCGVIVSISAIINCFKNVSVMTNFEGMRGIFDVGSYHVLCSFIIVFTVLFTNIKINLFKKEINYFCFIIMFIQLLLSLSRSAWIGVAIGCVSVLLLDLYNSGDIINFAKKIMAISIFVLLGGVFFFNAAPKSIVEEFTEKFDKTTEELNSGQEFSSVGDTMNNWRGYENQCAKKQWEQSPIMEELIGGGMGKGIVLEYVPYTWKEMVENDEIPLLHNGYYTILIKGGIVGFLALIWFMVSNILLGLRLLKKRVDIKFELVILIALEIVYLVLTYVVRGPVTQNVNIIWSILIGWISADIRRGKITNVSES